MTGISKRYKIWNKYDGHCAYCGSSITIKHMSIDHIIPKNKGGSNDIENLNPACKFCNGFKANLTMESFRGKLAFMLNSRPEEYLFNTFNLGIAENFTTISLKVEKWDGLFYFEKLNSNIKQ